MSDTVEPTRDVFESGGRGLRHTGVRRANERAVLTIVGFNSGVSNAEISRLSGLAPQTVSAILVDLERDGLVTRGPVLRGRRGQPATPILLNENGGLAIGVEIGWRHLDVLLLNMHARVLAGQHVDYAYPDAETIVETIGATVAEFRDTLSAEQNNRLRDLGVTLPGGLADHIHFLGAPPAQSQLWGRLDLAAALHQRTGLEVTLLNDGNAGCWAELIALQPPRAANVIYFLLSHYIAAGIVADGALWEGPTGNAGDLGAILVNAPGPAPQVAHRVASIWALRQRLEADGHAVAHLPMEALGRPEFAAGFSEWLTSAAQALAQVIYNATTVVEHPLIVVDTVLSPETSARLVGLVEAELARLPARIVRPPRVVSGQLGRLAPAIGAAELPLFRRYF